MQSRSCCRAGVKQSPLKMPLSSVTFNTQAEQVSEPSGTNCASTVFTLLIV